MDLEQRLPSWDAVAQVLRQETLAKLHLGLERLAKDLEKQGILCDILADSFTEGHMPLCFTIIHHWCFGEPEIWQNGHHTRLSSDRLRVVWACMKLLFNEYQ